MTNYLPQRNNIKDKAMKKYIEIVEREKEEVIKRLDVSDKSDRMIDRIESGININLNHDHFYTNQIESEVELPII